jgi:hypothetical protein
MPFLIEHFGTCLTYLFWLLFSILVFCIRLILMIRRVHISRDTWDRGFNFIYHHRGSIFIYSIVILLSISLVLCLGDFTLSQFYGSTISYDALRAWDIIT